MKGISPMIAVVLLIAFTVAIGGIISIFFTTFTRTQTTTVSGQTEDQIRCLNSVLAIKDVTGDAPTNTNVTYIFVSYDSGTIPLRNVTADVTCGAKTGTNTSLATYNTLAPGEMQSIMVNITDSTGSNCGANAVDVVRVRAICEGPSTKNEYPITTECKTGAGCGI